LASLFVDGGTIATQRDNDQSVAARNIIPKIVTRFD